MEWDRDVVSYSNQGSSKQLNDPENHETIRSKFRQFLREFRKGGVEETFYYRDTLHSNCEQRNYKIIVDFEHLNAWDPGLSEKFRNQPIKYLPLFEYAAQEVIAMSKVPKPSRDEIPKIQIQVINLTRTETSIRELQAEHISKLVRVPGIIISATKPSCKASKVTLMCTNCRSTRVISSARAFGTILLPRRCENSNDEKNERPCPVDPFIIIPDKSEFLDIQKLKLQESPEDIPTGEMPRHLWLFAERKLVNKVKPGSRVYCTGIYKIFDTKSQSKRNERLDISVRKPYIEIIGFEELNVNEKTGVFNTEEEEIIRELSRQGNIHDLISQSIAPAIWGSEDIKKAISCLLFGGSRKVLPDGIKLRGDINILLLGDPSVAKSQFLKFVHQVAPIAVYTSGKGSSAAGLTASVIKEAGTGEFHLEGGAMVLADGGVVCIDEFDKMREQDRVAIHEAMEQQTISIAKAGITTILNSRTSVLAAANPIFGRYDDLRTTNENIDFETTILSRFDLIFIIRDVKDIERDTRLAQHIMELHINIQSNNLLHNNNNNKTENINQLNDNNNNNNAPISPQLLAKYIAYARHHIHPRLTRSAADMLKNHYVNFRQDAKKTQQETGQQCAIPLTVRQLESLVRLSESLAKMELSQEANEDHVKEAVRLFKVSTLKAAKSGLINGGDGLLNDPKIMESIQKCERNIRRRLPIGSSTSVKKLCSEMLLRHINENIVFRSLDIMHVRGEIEFRARRQQVYRKK